MRTAILTWTAVIVGISGCIGAGAAILIWAARETTLLRRPSAAEAATDVGVEP